MSNVRIFKEIAKKKMGDVYTLFYVFGQPSSVKRLAKQPMLLQNSFRDASRVQDCWNLSKTRARTKNIYALRPNAAYLNNYMPNMPGAKKCKK